MDWELNSIVITSTALVWLVTGAVIERRRDNIRFSARLAVIIRVAMWPAVLLWLEILRFAAELRRAVKGE